MENSEKVKAAVKALTELEVLNYLYNDPKIAEALNNLSTEERQKVISEMRENPEYQKALNDALENEQ